MKRDSAREPGRAGGRVQRRVIEGEGLGASPGAKHSTHWWSTCSRPPYARSARSPS